MIKLKGYKQPKYRNKKVTVDGIEFDSIKEANRYAELKLLERAGKIKHLQMQVKFVVIPSQYEFYERYGKKGKRLKDGQRLLEKECVYIADFQYQDAHTGRIVVEDVKSQATKKKESYIIKRKLMLSVYGIRVIEV